jgi:hypothetical protein
MANPNPTTEIEAVNIMLASIGEAPVSSISNTALVDVSIAKSILDETNVSVQSTGIYSNTEFNYPIEATVDGELLIPANCVRIDTVGNSATVDVVQRGSRLYDREKFSFPKFVGTYYVEMVLLLPFNELPQHAKRYIVVKAARRFQARYMGSEALGGFTKDDEQEAMSYFTQCEAALEDNNIYHDSYDMYKIVHRGAPRRAIR